MSDINDMTQFFEKMTIIERDGTERKITPEEAVDAASALQRAGEVMQSQDWDGAARQLESMIEDLVIDHIGGAVPVQGEGTYKGIPFYFRARYRTASLSVGTHRDDGVASMWYPLYQAELVVTPDGDDYGAGWLSPDEVVAVFPVLVQQLEPRTLEDGEVRADAFRKRVDDLVEMMREADRLRDEVEGNA